MLKEIIMQSNNSSFLRCVLAVDAISSGAMGLAMLSFGSFIAQLLTMMVADRLHEAGDTPPVYISANIPGGDEHNHALEDRYRGRIRRLA